MRTNGRSKRGLGATAAGLFLARASNRGRSVAPVATEAAWVIWASLALVSLLFLARPAAAEMASPPPPLGQADDQIDWSEEETDELPEWAEEELDEARAHDWEQDGVYVQEMGNYGAGIPTPEEVMQGGRQQTPPVQHQAPAPQVQQVPAAAREFAPPADRVDFSDFRDGLEPHGRWADTPEYGRVFIPSRQTQVSGWRPYLYGQWVWTSYGWTWASDEPFGWATYHYGRWAYGPSLGWMWIPGYTWGPAWVVWRHGEGAVGWAPLYPGYVSYTATYPFFGDHWIFVAPARFYGHPIHRHWYRDRGSYYHSRSAWTRNWRPAGRGGIYAGPPRRYVERTGIVRIHTSRVVAVRSPDRRGIVARGSQPRGELRVYRPTNRGAVRAGRSAGSESNRSGLSAGAARPPRVGSGLGSRELPRETRREIDRPSRTPALRPTRPSGNEDRSPGRGGAVRNRDSRGSSGQGIPRQRQPALLPAPTTPARKTAPGKKPDSGTTLPAQPRSGSSRQLAPAPSATQPRSGGAERIAPSRQSTPPRSAPSRQLEPARQPTPSRPARSQELAPGRSRSAPSQQRGSARQASPSRAPRSSQLAPARQAPSQQLAPARSSARSSSRGSPGSSMQSRSSRSNGSSQLAPARKAPAKRPAAAKARSSERR